MSPFLLNNGVLMTLTSVCDSDRVDSLRELLASVRRQGVRAENLLKDGDNLIQQYRNLEARLQQQAHVQSALQRECDTFNNQAQSTRTWITVLLQPLIDPDIHTGEMKNRAKVSENETKQHLFFSSKYSKLIILRSKLGV